MVRRDPNDTSAKISRAIAMCRVSFCLCESDPNAAARLARQALVALDELMASGKKEYLIVANHAVALQRLAEAQLKSGHVAAARGFASSTLAERRSLTAQNQRGSADRTTLVTALILAGETEAAAGSFEIAESHMREAREEAEAIAKNRELTNVIPLAHAEQALGVFYAGRRRTDEARESYRQLAGLWRDFPEANEYVVLQREIAGRLFASLHY
jgi:Flp pilus assembly protein TadD